VVEGGRGGARDRVWGVALSARPLRKNSTVRSEKRVLDVLFAAVFWYSKRTSIICYDVWDNDTVVSAGRGGMREIFWKYTLIV
jgi:hypothetical protein